MSEITIEPDSTFILRTQGEFFYVECWSPDDAETHTTDLFATRHAAVTDARAWDDRRKARNATRYSERLGNVTIPEE